MPCDGDPAPAAIHPTLDRMFDSRRIKHCRVCGAPTQYRVPADDNRERAVCSACGEVHYENPLNVVGTVPVWGEQVLLCRRNIEPRYGLWTLPAGFMELGETTAPGAPVLSRPAARHPLRSGPGDHRGPAVPRGRG